jgi:hypothetical protein
MDQTDRTLDKAAAVFPDLNRFLYVDVLRTLELWHMPGRVCIIRTDNQSPVGVIVF